jgi:hypothetical protein
MAGRELTVDEIMAILPVTVGRIAELTDGLSEAQLHATPEPGEWSVNDILAHLRACHDVLGGRMLRILAEERPTWRAMSPRTWMARTDYPSWEFASAFEVFSAQRADLLRAFEPVPPQSWSQVAVETGLVGGPRERTVRYYGSWMASHERGHLRQIAKTVDAVRAASTIRT